MELWEIKFCVCMRWETKNVYLTWIVVGDEIIWNSFIKMNPTPAFIKTLFQLWKKLSKNFQAHVITFAILRVKFSILCHKFRNISVWCAKHKIRKCEKKLRNICEKRSTKGWGNFYKYLMNLYVCLSEMISSPSFRDLFNKIMIKHCEYTRNSVAHVKCVCRPI